MFNLTNERLEELGADITAGEIAQQPELWQEALNTYTERETEINDFLNDIQEKHGTIRVIFTGAGSSAFVGETVVDYLNKVNDADQWKFEAIATTDIVGNPDMFLQESVPTLLVSFARSGNSPESVATVKAAKQIVDDLYQLTITCAPEGKLAQAAEGDEDNLRLLQPDRSNDAGFAMTGSFSSMLLSTLLVFDTASLEEKSEWTEAALAMSEQVLSDNDQVKELIDLDFDRVVYLGQGSFYGLARETQLKILELTAGEIATLYDTPLGFRHGPKSFVDEQTLIITFGSSDDYTRQYDTDLINEVYHDQVAEKVLSLSVGENKEVDADQYTFDEEYTSVPDAYVSLPYVVFGQLVSLASSIKVGVKPDDPSPTGEVNRVVQGVVIYDYE